MDMVDSLDEEDEEHDEFNPKYKLKLARGARLKRDYGEANRKIAEQYFGDYPIYGSRLFRRRFRMRRKLFERTMADVTKFEPKFEQRYDAAQRPGLRPLSTKVCGCQSDVVLWLVRRQYR